MRSRLYLIAILTVLAVPFCLAQSETSLPERYLEIYTGMHDAENLEKKQDYAGALKGFQDCFKGYASIQQTNPNWETALVGHRMDDCKVTIQRLQNEVATATLKQSKPADLPPKMIFVKAPKKTHAPYPWKTGITTSMFWIGEGSPAANAWNIQWPKGTQGKDTPDDRNGFSAGQHASYFNPFYVALPFNDLAFPDLARQWVPADWQRAPENGKPVSACQHRWVEIKTEDGTGHTCYAQWEDVGPVNNNDAPYVFGNERPATADHTGLLISPAVVQYLDLAENINNHNGHSFVRWRFVDETDVQPGIWLKLDEEAILYTALHQAAPDLASTTPPAPKKEAPVPVDITPDSTKP